MNNIFRLMEGYGFIKSWEAWRGYYDQRNDTSHEYNQKKAIVLNSMDNLLNDINYFYNSLQLTISN